MGAANGAMGWKGVLATPELKDDRMRVIRPAQISLFMVRGDVTRPEKPEQKTVATLFCWTEGPCASSPFVSLAS